MIAGMVGASRPIPKLDLDAIVEKFQVKRTSLPVFLEDPNSRLHYQDIEFFMRSDFARVDKDILPNYFRGLERSPQGKSILTASFPTGDDYIAAAGIVYSETFDHNGTPHEHEYLDKLAKNNAFEVKGAAASVLYELIFRTAHDAPHKVVSLRSVGDKNQSYYQLFGESLSSIFPCGWQEYGPKRHQHPDAPDVWVYLFSTHGKSPEMLLDLAHSIAGREKTVVDVPKKERLITTYATA
jgi:hypothetical protein